MPKTTPTIHPGSDIQALYQQEMNMLEQGVRKQAAQNLFLKLRPSNRILVSEFIEQLQNNSDVWHTVSRMGIVEFAQGILGETPSDGPKTRTASKQARTRLSMQQKSLLSDEILKVLKVTPQGLSRHEISNQIGNPFATLAGIDPQELEAKLRQPLLELLQEKTISSVGQKRSLRYLLSTHSPKKKAPIKKNKKRASI